MYLLKWIFCLSSLNKNIYVNLANTQCFTLLCKQQSTSGISSGLTVPAAQKWPQALISQHITRWRHAKCWNYMFAQHQFASSPLVCCRGYQSGRDDTSAPVKISKIVHSCRSPDHKTQSTIQVIWGCPSCHRCPSQPKLFCCQGSVKLKPSRTKTLVLKEVNEVKWKNKMINFFWTWKRTARLKELVLKSHVHSDRAAALLPVAEVFLLGACHFKT